MEAVAQNSHQMPRRTQVMNISERWSDYERPQYFGVRFGMTASQLIFSGPSVDNSTRIGINGGIVAGFRLSKNVPIFFETGLMYQGKGAYINGGDADEIDIRAHFLELPLIFKWKIHTRVDYLKVQPLFGGFLAVGVAGETRFYQADPTVYGTDALGRYKRGTFSDGSLRAFDAGLRVGCGISYRNFYAELTYSISLTNAAQDEFQDFGYDSFDNTIRHGCLAFTLGLDF